MIDIPPDIRECLHQHHQEHVVAWWSDLDDSQRQGLLAQIRSLKLDEIRRLYEQRDQKSLLPPAHSIVPLPWPDNQGVEQSRGLGEDAFRAGHVAFLVVAGGQGSRLGFEHPKGMFPVGPVSNKSLFQIHAEKILALSRRYKARIPLLVMTSPATDPETEPYFREHNFFGLPAEDVHFFCQGTMPAVDLATGKLLLEDKGRLFLSPNGHGGTLTALADSGLLDELRGRGIRTVYYFQVDNPLVNLADIGFLGQHVARNAEVSSKVFPKESPTDKLGNFVLVDGRCTIIEYSDLPEEQARERDEQRRLRLWAGSPAIHLFDVAFLTKVTQAGGQMPWHLARKKVPYLDPNGNHVQPNKENALKFERFIFDVLPLAERWTVVATTRREFEPLKNATGPDSPETVRAALSAQAADWLEHAGKKVPRTAQGQPSNPLEISPLFALDAEELSGKLPKSIPLDRPTYLE